MVKPLVSAQSIGQVEVGAPPPEVLVELAPHAVEARGGLEHARGDPAGQVGEHALVVAELRVGEAHETVRCAGDHQRAERAVDRGIGHVEQALGGGALGHGFRGARVGKPAGGSAQGGFDLAGHGVHSSLSFFKPSNTLRRAASSDDSSRWASSA